MDIERTPKEWFAVADHCYTENHQGCPWCDESHCVFQMNSDAVAGFECSRCDFHVGFNKQEDRFFFIRGEDLKSAPPTMYKV